MPDPQQQTQQPDTSNMVPAYDPDGKFAYVPHEKWTEAQGRGFKVAMHMTDPNGQLTYAPQENVSKLVKERGFKIGPPPSTNIEAGGGDQQEEGIAKRSIEGVERGLKGLFYDLPKGVYHAATDPATPQEQQQFKTMTPEDQRSILSKWFDPSRSIEKQARSQPEGRAGLMLDRLLMKPAQAEQQKAQQAAEQGKTSETLGHSVAAAVPGVGPWAASLGERAGKGDVAGALAEGATTMLAPKVAGKMIGAAVSPTTQEFFSKGMEATAHDMLNKVANTTKAKFWDAHGQVSQRVGRLVNDVAAADYATKTPTISNSDLVAKAAGIGEKYKAGGPDTPKFNAVVKALTSRQPELYWKDLHDVKMEARQAWSKAAEGSRDGAAANELSKEIESKLSERASEVKRGEQYGAYNKLWKTLMGYEDGAVGKLLNADSGKSFFDAVRDPANKAQISRALDDLSKFGLDPDVLTNVQKSHGPLHDYLQSRTAGVSRVKLALQNPKAALIPMVAGSLIGTASGVPMGGFLGGTGGALAGVKGAARLGAAKVIGEMGRPSLAGEMGEAAKVQPVGSGERPTPPEGTLKGGATPPAQGQSPEVNKEFSNQVIQEYMDRIKNKPAETPQAPGTQAPTINPDDIASALVNQGVKKGDAAALAKKAVEENPHDFDAALKSAFSQRSKAPQAKAAAVSEVKSQKVGSEEASKADTNDVAQAKQLLGPNASTSEILMKAQELKTRRTSQPSTKQGGHSGGGVASEEELNRPGINYTVSKSNQVTYHGKPFAPESTPAGGVHVTVLPDGTFRENQGSLTGAQRQALEKAVQESKPKESGPKSDLQMKLEKKQDELASATNVTDKLVKKMEIKKLRDQINLEAKRA